MNANLKEIWSSRHHGLGPALILSVIGHGLLLHGLIGRGIGSVREIDSHIIQGELLVRFQKPPALESLVVLVDAIELVPSDMADKSAVNSGFVKNNNIDKTRYISADDEQKGVLEPANPDGSLSPEEKKSDASCLGQRIEPIPDTGHSNRLGRRKEENPCEQG